MNINSNVKIIGIHTFRNYDLNGSKAEKLEGKIFEFLKSPLKWRIKNYDLYKRLIQELRYYFLTKESVFKNIVVTVGRSVLAQRLAGTTTYTGTINYGALGSSATTPTNADTQLGTEVFRKVVASATYATNSAFIDFFYSKADTNGTYNEFGSFIDGSGSANSGQMFSHFATGGWSKLSTESMTVSSEYDMN